VTAPRAIASIDRAEIKRRGAGVKASAPWCVAPDRSIALIAPISAWRDRAQRPIARADSGRWRGSIDSAQRPGGTEAGGAVG
jgi:hypothetical protein